MQQVDPFIPVRPGRQPRPKALPDVKAVPQPRRPQLKPFVHPRQSLTPQQTPPARRQFDPPQKTAAARPHMTSKPQHAPKARKHIWSTLAQALLLVGALGLGFLIRSPIVGQVAILLYAVLCFVYRIESRTTFILALMAMGVVLISSLRADGGLAGAFAIYAFLLLIIATLSLAREVREEI